MDHFYSIFLKMCNIVEALTHVGAQYCFRSHHLEKSGLMMQEEIISPRVYILRVAFT